MFHMHMQTDWHIEFATAVLHPDEAVPSGLQDPYGRPTLKRFAVYRNNIVAGLTEALRVDFPAVCRIVGEDFFAAMARIYVLQHPPRSPVLLEYGEHFATFIDNFEPAESVPYLGDVARIERGWLEAYHSAEATPFKPSALTSIPSEYLHCARFHLHPSVRVVRSKFPAFTIWSTNIEGGTPTPVDLEAGGENVLVSRSVAEVEIRTLSDPGVEFICSVAEGNTICEATRTALAFDSCLDLSWMFTSMIEAGIFVAHPGDDGAITNDERGHCVT
jgi:hypothetical protein